VAGSSIVGEGREPAATGSRHGRGGGSPPPPDLALGEGWELAAAGSRRGSAAGGGTAGCSVRGRRRGRASPWEEEGPPYAAAAGGEGARVLLLRPRKGTERRRKTTERGRKFAYRVASDAKCIPCLGSPLEGVFLPQKHCVVPILGMGHGLPTLLESVLRPRLGLGLSVTTPTAVYPSRKARGPLPRGRRSVGHALRCRLLQARRPWSKLQAEAVPAVLGALLPPEPRGSGLSPSKQTYRHFTCWNSADQIFT